MNKSTKFFPEVREGAARMVQEHRGDCPTLWSAIESIAPKIGFVPQTLVAWVQPHEIGAGVRDGVTTAEAKRVKELERKTRNCAGRTRSRSWPARFSPRRSSTAD